MADKNNKADFQKFLKNVKEKRQGKASSNNKDASLEYLTIQRLSASVEGRSQKYSRIGPLTMVKFNGEMSLENIKRACEIHFEEGERECDVLAGERGPSFTDISQIKKFNLLHVRFVEPKITKSITPVHTSSKRPRKETFVSPVSSTQSKMGSFSRVLPSSGLSSENRCAASVPLSNMLGFGKLIAPKKDIITVKIEEFSIITQNWLDPFEAKFIIEQYPFAEGGFRNVYRASGLTKMFGKYVVKKYKEGEVAETVYKMFHSIEEHTRKVVQMHSLARNFALKMEEEGIKELFGETFKLTKLYLGAITPNSEFVTIEKFIDGDFEKYINNDGTIVTGNSEVFAKAETFAHYTYTRSANRLMVLDIQGCGYSLFDPEIASVELRDANEDIYFCLGNCSTEAITKFIEQHKCNQWCHKLKLESFQ